MADKLVKIVRSSSGTVCECSADMAERLTATKQWELFKAPRATPAKLPTVAADE